MAEHAGAAMRRRQRRLRQWLRHERLSVAMALAEMNHHAASRGQTKARAGGEARVALHGHDPEAPLPQGSRPPCLGVPRGPHARVQRRTVQLVVDAVPLVPLLDDPVPQMVDTVLEFFRALDLPIGEQVIAVPQISTDRVSQRLVERRLPQMVEQLVEVPTVVSYSSLLQREAKKKEEEKMEKRVAKHTAAQSEAAETMQRARLLLEQAGKRRKRKKRRKKKLPKASSSRSSCASHAARTRISGHSSTRPFYLAVLFGVMVLPEEYFGAFPYSAIPGFTMDTVHASVAGAFGYYFTYFCVKVDLVSRGQFSLFRAPMVVFRPEMPRILVGMTRRTVTWRESGSVMCKACFAGFYTSRCIPSVVLKLMMPCIMAGMDQRDSYLVRVWQCHVQGLFCWFLHLALYSSRCSHAHDALHHGRYGPEGQLFGESLAVACTMLGFSGVSAPRAVFPSLSSGPRCPSSWPAWTTGQMEVHRSRRRHLQWYVLAGFAGDDTLRAVFFDVDASRCFPSLSSGP